MAETETETYSPEFETAIEVTISREGGFAFVRRTGEVVKYGITLRLLRSLGIDADINYVRHLTIPQAKAIYWEHFWQAAHVSLIHDPLVRGLMFDQCVINGIGTPIRCLQDTLYDLGYSPTVDGILGPKTAAMVNAECSNDEDRELLLAEFRHHMGAHYNKLGEDPKHAPDVEAWIARLTLPFEKIQ